MRVAANYYNVMIIKARKHGPIRFIAMVIVALVSIRQLMAIHNKILTVLFLLNNGLLVWLHSTINKTALRLVLGSTSRRRGRCWSSSEATTR